MVARRTSIWVILYTRWLISFFVLAYSIFFSYVHSLTVKGKNGSWKGLGATLKKHKKTKKERKDIMVFKLASWIKIKIKDPTTSSGQLEVQILSWITPSDQEGKT